MSATCPDCQEPHDPRPCAEAGVDCGCCAAMFPNAEARAEATL